MFPTVPRCFRRSICTSATLPSSRTATRVSRSEAETRSSFGTRGVYPRPPGDPASHVDVAAVRAGENQSHHAPRRDERGPTIRDEWQRNAGRGHDADVHRDVHERLGRDVEDEEQDEHRPAAVARVARERGGAMLVLLLILNIAAQALVNVAMNVGVMPTTGITLPFVSYGGSSLVATWCMVGLILSGAYRRYVNVGCRVSRWPRVDSPRAERASRFRLRP